MKIIQFLAGLLLLVLSTQPYASTSTGSRTTLKPTQAINACPGGLVVGAVSFNYEYLYHDYHGLVIRADYDDVPDRYTDAEMESSGKGFALTYRYHFSGAMESFYIGPYYRYRLYSGQGNSQGTPFDFDITEQTIGLSAGKRWVWQNGLNLNLSLGYGVSSLDKKADVSSASIDRALDDFESDYDGLTPFMGEFSVGYAF